MYDCISPRFKEGIMKKNQKSAYLFLMPSLIILSIFVFIPLGMAFVISLMNIDIYMNNITFAGFSNYLNLLKDSRVWNATKNTFVFAAFEVPAQIFIALFLLMFMSKNTKLHKALRTIYYIPYVCSMTAVSILWSRLLNVNQGILPYILKKIGINLPNLLASTSWAMPTVISVTVWKSFGYTLTILSAAALGVSSSLYEAAEMDGATGVKQFLYVTIPEIMDSIGFCLVTTLIVALQVFDQIYVMTSGGPQYSTETLVGYIYNRGFQTAPYDLGYASAVAVYLFVIIAALTFITRKYGFRQEAEE